MPIEPNFDFIFSYSGVRIFVFCIFLFLVFPFHLFSQELSNISDYTIRVDNQIYRFSKDKIQIVDRWVLPFPVQKKDATVEMVLEIPLLDVEAEVALAKSGDFTVIDSLEFISENEMRIKLRIHNLDNADLISVNFKLVTIDKKEKLIPIFL